MTADPRIERSLPRILADLGAGTAPDYVDSLLARTAATRQRPGWVFLERWLPMSVVTSRVATAPPVRWRTLVVLALLIVALVAATALVVGSQRTKVPPPFGPAANGSVLYAWQGDILARATPTSSARTLIGGDTNDFAPSYSPDGTRLAFFRDAGNYATEVWVAHADGSHAVRVGGPYHFCCGMDWAPQGDVIALAWTSESGVPVIDLIRTDGSGSTRLDLGFPADFPVFRPTDGAQLLFRGRAVDGKGWSFYLANSDGSGATKLAIEPDAGYGSDDDFVDPAWSPDGGQLAFVLKDAVRGAPGGIVQRIHVADIARNGMVTDERQLTGAIDSDSEYGPQWLPTGDAIVYRQWRGVGEELWVAPPDHSTVARYLGVSAGSSLPFAVSPDSTQVLVSNTYDRTLRRVDLTSGATDKLFAIDDGPSYQRLAP